jgi:hypothetical protein
MDWLAGMLLVTMALLPVLTALALPPLAVALPPPMATAVDWLADLATLVPTPTPTAVWAQTGPVTAAIIAAVVKTLCIGKPPLENVTVNEPYLMPQISQGAWWMVWTIYGMLWLLRHKVGAA